MNCKEIDKFAYLLYIYLCIYSIFSICFLSIYFSKIQDKLHILTFITMIFSFGTLIWFVSSTIMLIYYIKNKNNNRIRIQPDITLTVASQ